MYQWKENKTETCNDEPINALKDLKACPDIIVSLCEGTPSKDAPGTHTRVGYARIPADADFLGKSVPQWIKFKSTKNNYEDRSPGSLLCNGKLMRI